VGFCGCFSGCGLLLVGVSVVGINFGGRGLLLLLLFYWSFKGDGGGGGGGGGVWCF